MIIIIGAGAVGLTSAISLLEAGRRVTVLEQGAVGREASWAGGGILSPLCPWDYPEPVTRLALAGMAGHGALAGALHQATGIDPEYLRCGMEVRPPFDLARAHQWCAAHGMACEVRGEGLFLPGVAQVRNPRLLAAMRVRVAQLGGVIREQCGVEDFVEREGRIVAVATTQGEMAAADFVVSAGAWSQRLLGRRAGEVKIHPVRGQMLLFKFPEPPLPHIVLAGDLYLIPRRDGHLLVGSTLEEAGFDKSTTSEARASLQHRAAAILPPLAAMQPVQHWAGLRPGSPGNVPTIGRHPQLANLYLNGGHFRYGVTMAPASAELLINEMLGRPQPFDVAPYRWRA